jgi:hypothetical protein
MKYRIFTLLGLLALSAGAILQAQDYDDIYYDASKSSTGKTKVVKPAKTVAVYGEVPDTYKVAAQSNYRIERDEDEYNRRGAYEQQYEVDINGDTLYLDSLYMEDEAFANTRRIERFYNPDIVILSDDDDLVELYYDESPTINLVVGSEWGYSSLGFSSYYYPWYTGWYSPWYYTPWWHYYYSPWHYSWYGPDYYYYGWRWHGPSLWGWNYWGVRPYHHRYWNDWAWRPNGHNYYDRPHMERRGTGSGIGGRAGLANNRNDRGRVSATPGSNRNGVSARGADGNRPSGVGATTGRGRGSGTMGSRNSGNMGSRSSSGVTSRNAPSGGYSSGGRSSGGSYSSGGSRSSGGSYSSGGSRSSGGSHSSGGSYSGGGGSRGSSGGGGGSHGGSSGGGGRRR